MKRANELEENKNLKESSKIRAENNPITILFANNVNEAKIEKYPQEIDYYLSSDREKIDSFNKEISVLETQINENLGTKILTEKLQRKNNLTERSEKLKKEISRNAFIRYLSYITNNERL
jgi:hypothetical protein